jgi:hypothetical protein
MDIRIEDNVNATAVPIEPSQVRDEALLIARRTIRSGRLADLSHEGPHAAEPYRQETGKLV